MSFIKKYLTAGMIIQIVCITILITTLPLKLNDVFSSLISIVLILLLIGLVIQEVKAINLKNSITPINKIAIDFINSSFYKVNYVNNGEKFTDSLNLFLEYKKITLSESEFEYIGSFVWSFYSQNHNK